MVSNKEENKKIDINQTLVVLLMKVAALEKTLIDSNMIDKKKYEDNLGSFAEELQKILENNTSK